MYVVPASYLTIVARGQASGFMPMFMLCLRVARPRWLGRLGISARHEADLCFRCRICHDDGHSGLFEVN